MSVFLLASALLGGCTHQPTDKGVSPPLAGVSSGCEDSGFCTREYQPTTCRFENQDFGGSNRCEALKLARRFACENKVTFEEAKVDCNADTLPSQEGM